MPMTSYGFLEQLHATLKPRGYLEIGVRYGDSIKLAKCPAIGIDPNISGLAPNGPSYFAQTSDDFFAHTAKQYLELWGVPIDLAYIDGMHLVEYALRDFINIERYANERTVVVFDDVLPYSEAIATREQPPGDWTGDVWKVIPLLQLVRPDLALTVVDVFPTGALVVTGLDPANTRLSDYFEQTAGPHVQAIQGVPAGVLSRADAVEPAEAIQRLLATVPGI